MDEVTFEKSLSLLFSIYFSILTTTEEIFTKGSVMDDGLLLGVSLANPIMRKVMHSRQRFMLLYQLKLCGKNMWVRHFESILKVVNIIII